MLFDTSTYLLTLEIGVPVVCLAWFVARRMQRKTRAWRIGISALLALTVAPTVYSIHGESWILPAVWILRVLRWDIPNRLLTCLEFGIAPIVVTTAVIFGFWSLFCRRNNSNITKSE
jgi:hypothetical protein